MEPWVEECAVMDYWARAPLGREQTLLFCDRCNERRSDEAAVDGGSAGAGRCGKAGGGRLREGGGVASRWGQRFAAGCVTGVCGRRRATPEHAACPGPLGGPGANGREK